MENSEISDKERRAALFKRCIDEKWHAGKPKGEAWNRQKVCTALGITDKTYDARMGGEPTFPKQMANMVAVFLGNEPEDPQFKANFVAAWSRPPRPSRRKAASVATREAQPPPEDEPDTVVPPASRYTGEMIPETVAPAKPHPLFQIKIDPPPQASTEEAFDLMPDLRPGFVRVPSVALHVAVGLNRVTLDLVAKNCATLGPRAGDGNTKNPGMQQGAAGGWEYVGPKDSALTDIFNDFLARLVWTQHDAPPSLELTATAFTDDVGPRYLEDETGDRDIWTGVRDAWLTQMARQKLAKNGKIDLGTATLRWKPKA